MKPITPQRCRAICIAEGLDFKDIKRYGPYLLRTGAKISWDATFKYKIYGYAYDGSDIVPYNKRQGVVMSKPPTKEHLRYAQVSCHHVPLADHLQAGRVSRVKNDNYVIWCPDGIGVPSAWQKMQIERLASFGIVAKRYLRAA